MSENRRISDIVIPNPKVTIKKGSVMNYLPMEEISSSVRYAHAIQKRTYKGGSRFSNGDVIFARITPCLQNRKIAQYVNENGDDSCGSTEYFVFRSIRNISDSSYLYYLMRSDYIVETAIKSMRGASGRQRAQIEPILKLMLYIPEYQNQVKIGRLLSAYDDLIENNNRRIAILEEMAQKHYRHEAQKTEKTCLLGDLVTFKRGKNITKETINEGNVAVVAGGLQPAYYHNKANTKSPILTVSASGANAGYVNLYHEDIWASDCSFIDANNSDNVFFFYVCMKALQEQITFMQRGSAQPHVYPDDLSRLEIPYLSQDAIATINKQLYNIFSAIANLTTKNTNLRKTRDLLIPALINGDIDVSNLPIQVKED